MQRALRMLLRSAACLCQDFANKRHMYLPFHWSPFAWLALVADVIQGTGQFSDLPAVHTAPIASTRFSGINVAGQPPFPLLHPAFHVHDEDDDSEWNLVQVRG